MTSPFLTLEGRKSAAIARYGLSEYLQARVAAVTSLGFGSYASTGTVGGRTVEQIENSYAGYVAGAYKTNTVVAACMRVRRDLFRQAKFCWREIGDSGPGKSFRDDELSLLERPWPNGTTGELLSRMITDVDLCGNSYIVNEGDRLRWLRPDWVSIVLSADPQTEVNVDVMGYVYAPGGGDLEHATVFQPKEICHWSPDPDPLACYRGQSWLTPAIREIQADSAATEHKLMFFTNGATLGPIVKVPKEVTIDQFKEFVAAADAAHVGSSNAYRPFYIGGGVDVTLSQATMAQLEFKATQGAGETRIAALAGVHPVLVGLSEGLAGSSLNAGNFNSARRSTADITLWDLWISVCAALSPFLKVPDNAELWIRSREIPFLREDAKDQAEITKSKILALESGIRSGFKPDALVEVVDTDDITALEGQHSNLYSVQLQPAGPDPNNPAAPTPLDLTRPGQAPAEPTPPEPFTTRAYVGYDLFDDDDEYEDELDYYDEDLERAFNIHQPRWGVDDILEGLKVGGRWKPSDILGGKRRQIRASHERLRRRLRTAATARSHSDIVEALTSHPDQHVRGIHKQLKYSGSRSKPIATVRDEVAAALLKRELEHRYPTPAKVKPSRTKVARPRSLPTPTHGSGRDWLDEMDREPDAFEDPTTRPYTGGPEPGTPEYDNMVDELLTTLDTPQSKRRATAGGKQPHSVAETLAELDELQHNSASSRVISHRMRTRGELNGLPSDLIDRLANSGRDPESIRTLISDLEREHGLTRTTGPSGAVEPLNRNLHRMAGDAPWSTTGYVTVMRPGYRGKSFTMPAVVLEADVPRPVALTGSMSDLMAIAAREGVPIPAGATRAEVIALIRKFRASARASRDVQRSGVQEWLERHNPNWASELRIPTKHVGGGRWMKLGTVLQLIQAELPNRRQRVEIRPSYLRLKTKVGIEAQLQRDLRSKLRHPDSREVTVDLGDRTPVATAREYAEGLLRMAERHPNTRLTSVRVATIDEPARPKMAFGHSHVDQDVAEIVFGRTASRARASRLAKLKRSAEVDPGVAGDDFSYVAAVLFAFTMLDGNLVNDDDPKIGAALRRYLRSRNIDPNDSAALRAIIQAELGSNALRSDRDMMAAALADVALNGDQAMPISKALVKAILAQIRAGQRVG